MKKNLISLLFVVEVLTVAGKGNTNLSNVSVVSVINRPDYIPPHAMIMSVSNEKFI